MKNKIMAASVLEIIMAAAVFVVAVTFGLWWGLIALGVAFFLHSQLDGPDKKDDNGDEG